MKGSEGALHVKSFVELGVIRLVDSLCFAVVLYAFHPNPTIGL